MGRRLRSQGSAREISTGSQEAAREIAQRRDTQQFRRGAGPAVRDEFERRAWEQIREAKKRHEEEKKRGKDRDSGRKR